MNMLITEMLLRQMETRLPNLPPQRSSLITISFHEVFHVMHAISAHVDCVSVGIATAGRTRGVETRRMDRPAGSDDFRNVWFLRRFFFDFFA
jgi:hypothetical protein